MYFSPRAVEELLLSYNQQILASSCCFSPAMKEKPIFFKFRADGFLSIIMIPRILKMLKATVYVHIQNGGVRYLNKGYLGVPFN